MESNPVNSSLSLARQDKDKKYTYCLIDDFIPLISSNMGTKTQRQCNYPNGCTTGRKSRYIKSAAIRELEAMANEADRIKYPNVPYLAPRSFKDSCANSLTKCIVTYITLKGGFASRINSTGIYRPNIGMFTTGTQIKGIADVWATYKGLSLQIEVKHGKDRQSEAQRIVEGKQRLAGGHYILVQNFTEFKTWIDQL